jgi:hypothetical protein
VEDRWLQGAVRWRLEALDEADFLPLSDGYWPGVGARMKGKLINERELLADTRQRLHNPVWIFFRPFVRVLGEPQAATYQKLELIRFAPQPSFPMSITKSISGSCFVQWLGGSRIVEHR